MGCANRQLIGVIVEIRRFVNGHQPGWVECAFTDAHGREWLFVEKIPVVTTAELDATSSYPRSGVIACRVVARGSSESESLVVVDTALPYGIVATTGETRFEIRVEQLTDV